MEQLNTYDYYVGRAECARKLAARAASSTIAGIHEEMARRYDGIVAEIEAKMYFRFETAQAA